MAEKKYYRISEVSQITGVEPHVLRYWEKEFRQIRPRRVRGQRLYSRKHLDIIQRIKQLLHEEGFTIAGAKKRLERDDGFAGLTIHDIRKELLRVCEILEGRNIIHEGTRRK